MNYKRYTFSRNLAWEILNRERIKELPIKLIPLCKRMRIRVIKYSDAPQIKDKNGDGFQAVIDGKLYILYDDALSPERKRFTIAHELGHIIMKHSGFPEDESSANVFASRLLMPACVLHECGVQTEEEIMQMCGVSHTAAKYRLERLKVLRERNKWYTHPLERKVRRRFSRYIKGYIKDPRRNREAAQALKSFLE